MKTYLKQIENFTIHCLGLEWEYWLETGGGGGGGGGGGVLGHSNGRMNLDLLSNEVGGVNNSETVDKNVYPLNRLHLRFPPPPPLL